MRDTGWVIAGQGSSVSRSQTAWSSPGNITADDGSNATNTGVTAGGDTTDWLVADQFSLSSLIPAGSTILGFQVKIQCSSSIFDSGIDTVNVGKNGTTLGTAKTINRAISGSMTDYTIGGPDDLWGLSWTLNEAVASTVQARVYFRNDNKSSSATFSVDAIWIRVFYSPPGETTVFLTTTGEGKTWAVPTDWNSNSNVIECIGGGAGGGSSENGGGGGAYSRIANLALSPGASISYRVGSGGAPGSNGGDTWFNGTSLTSSSVSAEGGKSTGAGGAAANGIGSTKYSGGTGGAAGGGIAGGGGGGAAGPAGDGGNGGAGQADSDNQRGGGGGGNGGGTNGATGASSGSQGGNNYRNAGSGAQGVSGTAGGGGGGAAKGSSTVGNGGAGTEWDATHGSGGGGGGQSNADNAGNGGLYGGGGGGDDGIGAQGLIVISYVPNAAKTRSYIVG